MITYQHDAGVSNIVYNIILLFGWVLGHRNKTHTHTHKASELFCFFSPFLFLVVVVVDKENDY